MKIITSQIGAILVVQSMNISPPKTVNADDVFNYLIQRKCSQVAYEFKTLIDTDSFPPQNRENSLERTPQSLSNNSHRDSIVRRQIFTVPRNKHIIALAPKNPAENICMSDNEELVICLINSSTIEILERWLRRRSRLHHGRRLRCGLQCG